LENTAKFALGAPLATLTAGTPACCTTAKDAVAFVAVSLAGEAAAVLMAWLTGVPVGEE
jgi:hypothetical protein